MEVLLSAARDDMRLTGQLPNYVTVPLANMVGQDEAYKQDLLPSPMSYALSRIPGTVNQPACV